MMRLRSCSRLRELVPSSPAEVFGDGLAGQCFADAWGAVEDDVEPLTFALDYVVDGFGGVETVGTDEAFEIGLDAVGENEGFEGFGVPFDLLNT
jgi:hypothetical protein